MLSLRLKLAFLAHVCYFLSNRKSFHFTQEALTDEMLLQDFSSLLPPTSDETWATEPKQPSHLVDLLNTHCSV
jgi:hypothetical protein